MGDLNLEEKARLAITESVWSLTVAVDVSLAANESGWGTGSLIEINKRFFVLTCKHVVKSSYQNADLRFLFRPEGSLIDAHKDRVKHTPIQILSKISTKSYAQTLPLINRFYSDSDDDLALLEIDSSAKEIKDLIFFNLNKGSILPAEPNTPTYMFGFSVELARMVDKQGVAVFHYFLGSGVIEPKADYAEFDPQRHFLVDFTLDEEAARPNGLSGCGVWARLPSGKDNLWTPNLYFIGVQSAFYPNGREGQPIKATKAERVLQLAKDNGII